LVSCKPDSPGTSTIVGIILMVVITIILAAIVLAQIFLLPNFVVGPVPALFNITTIRHVNDDGVMTYDSRMVIKNTGTVAYPNRNLMAKVYRNGIPP
jgi:FlaG/FlaF family flagellin (archaellin)